MAKGRAKYTRNPVSALYRRLTKLFSGPIVDYQRQIPSALKRKELKKYKFYSANGGEFKKDVFNPFTNTQLAYMANQDRTSRYQDYRSMEYMPELNSALDLYADEMTTFSSLEPLLRIECPNEEIKVVLGSLFYDTLNLEHNLFHWARAMCKYGDFFLYLDVDENEGIKNVIGLPEGEIERVEGQDVTNPNYVQFQWNAQAATFENWQIAHFRNLGNDKYVPYGTSVIDSARRIWKQLVLLEDAMMAYRIVRAPDRRVFYIDVGGIAPEDVESYIQKVQTQMKRNQVINEDTGRVDLRYNPLSIEEDIYIPKRGEISSRVEALQGGQYTGDIDDVKYLRDKLFSAIKIPQSYLSQDGGGSEDKSSLSQKDILFAKTIQRLQLALISELTKIATIHLFSLGYRQKDLISFNLILNNPSKISEMQHLEELRIRFDIASGASDIFSKRWIAKKIFKLSEEEIVRNTRERFYDAKLLAELEKLAAANEMGEEMGGMGELGGEGGEDLDMGDEEEPLPGIETGEEETVPAAEEETLLAAPAKRDEEVFVRMPKSKVRAGQKWTGSLKSKEKMNVMGATDKRTGFGPRQKSLKPNVEKSRIAKRNVFPGSEAIGTLSKGIRENKEILEESKILSLNNELKEILKGLEEKKNDKNTKDE
jgi:hypothetical protein